MDHGFCGVHSNCFACAFIEWPLPGWPALQGPWSPFHIWWLLLLFSLSPPLFLSFVFVFLPPLPSGKKDIKKEEEEGFECNDG